MKLITSPALSEQAAKLQDVTIGDRILSCTLDIFSCKRTNDEKKVAGKLNVRQDEECKHLTELNNDKMQDKIHSIKEQRKRSSSISSESDYTPGYTQRKRSKSNDYENDATAGTSPNSHSNSKTVDKNEAVKPTLPPKPSVTMTSLGDLSDPSVRRLHTDLILTLNATFSDYNFDSLKPSSFKRLSHERSNGAGESVININNRLHTSFASTSPTSNPGSLGGENVDVDRVLGDMWGAVGEIVELKECEVFSYIPEVEGDPFSEDGVLWSFNYFMFHKSEKKILYFTCLARTLDRHFASNKGTMDEDERRILREEEYSEEGGSERENHSFSMDFD